MLALTLLVGLSAAAPCSSATAADLQAPLLDGESGVIQLEEDAVQGALTRVDAQVRCLSVVLSPTEVAAVHRMHA